jgi:hypothetical protein
VSVGLSVILLEFSAFSAPRRTTLETKYPHPHTQTHTHTGFCSQCSAPRKHSVSVGLSVKMLSSKHILLQEKGPITY